MYKEWQTILCQEYGKGLNESNIQEFLHHFLGEFLLEIYLQKVTVEREKKITTVRQLLMCMILKGPFFMILKVHKIENFFCSDFEFCPISLLIMHKYVIRFWGENFLIGPLWGELRLFRVVLRLRGMKKIFELIQKIFSFFFFYEPFIWANTSFYEIRSINCARDGFMRQYWAKMSIYSPKSQTKRNRV
jgi:hypothetical protein